jgi:tetratricopeptide (TPR) repeat protein
MDPQSGAIADKEFKRALKELGEGNVLAALACLEKGLKIWDDPRWYSFLGFCIAKERGHVKKGVELCKRAMACEPDNPGHYLYLGKVYLIDNNKNKALHTLRQGMALGNSPEIEQLLATIGIRRPPVIPFLSRNNPINKYLGIILSRLGLR